MMIIINIKVININKNARYIKKNNSNDGNNNNHKNENNKGHNDKS